ncbi:unnamed protein product [Toxocara canis]|uniref:Uncharacterized protein n=1 Tax=Toxocara canis TaxID=6265 RepID=A0A183UTW3_TOXCA|nr:unnamed protein product [Toxocara canis]
MCAQHKLLEASIITFYSYGRRTLDVHQSAETSRLVSSSRKRLPPPAPRSQPAAPRSTPPQQRMCSVREPFVLTCVCTYNDTHEMRSRIDSQYVGLAS